MTDANLLNQEHNFWEDHLKSRLRKILEMGEK